MQLSCSSNQNQVRRAVRIRTPKNGSGHLDKELYRPELAEIKEIAGFYFGTRFAYSSPEDSKKGPLPRNNRKAGDS